MRKKDVYGRFMQSVGQDAYHSHLRKAFSLFAYFLSSQGDRLSRGSGLLPETAMCGLSKYA
jgi:hypothetical protein